MGMPSYRVRKAVAGSVPCSATKNSTTNLSRLFFCLFPVFVVLSGKASRAFARPLACEKRVAKIIFKQL